MFLVVLIYRKNQLVKYVIYSKISMVQNKKILAIIPARANSKRIKNKNIKKFCGKPLIHWTIDQAKNSSIIDRVIVSTDSETIKEISIASGAEVPFLRPKIFAQDHSSTNDCIIHLLDNLQENYDIIILLQPTSPLRKDFHIKEATEYFINHKNVESLVSVKKNTNRLNLENNLIYDLFDKNTLNLNEKNMPKSLSPNGSIYISTRINFLKNKTFYTNKTYLYIMNDKHSVDIDYEKDFLYATKLFGKT